MICLASYMPLLRVGGHEVVHYEAGWLEHVIQQAAAAAGHHAWWPAADVARGVIQYLRDRFEQNAITLQDLFQRVSQTLRHIGFPEIAGQIHLEAPPVDLCLLELAREAEGLEFAFYGRLAGEMKTLREDGVRCIRASNLRAAISELSATRKWNRSCGRLEEDVLSYVDQLVRKTKVDGAFAVWLTH